MSVNPPDVSLSEGAPVSASVSIFDARPFFEKALRYGLDHGLIDAAKLESIKQDAPKGIVQIAAYFGSEFLRPELERARERMVNLISLHLQDASGGDLRRAAELLRDHSLLSRSKAGSDMLKRLIAMPKTSHFGMSERRGFGDDQIPQLAKWTLRPLADYQLELAHRRHASDLMDAATWLAEALGLDDEELADAGADAEAVVRTALLTLATGREKMPDWVAFEKTMAALRKLAEAAAVRALTSAWPADMPAPLRAAAEPALQSVLADLPVMLQPTTGPAVRKLFCQTPAFVGRYFWIEDGLSELDHHERTASKEWERATGGHSDEGALLTMFLHLAVGNKPKTSLTETSAATLVRKARKVGLQPAVVNQFIRLHAPAALQEGYSELWQAFMGEAQPLFKSDAVTAHNDALALLRLECIVKTPS